MIDTRFGHYRKTTIVSWAQHRTHQEIVQWSPYYPRFISRLWTRVHPPPYHSWL